MPDIIQLLPDSIANQIAAGEVIQRPASVVKELMENAVDAGSSTIQLIVKDAGKTLIQVVDNGQGMTDTDARVSFERHATSKIRKLEDIFSIYTMGFRGEALASIAAIAQVELKSKKRENDLGTLIEINGSKVLKQEPCGMESGTSIAVKNLFFNVPARRNFLKSNSVEMRHIIDEFTRISLAHPNIFFSLYHNDEEVFHLKEASLRQRIVAIFGNNTNEKLVPVSEETDYLSVDGFIGKPEFARKTRGEQFFFLNNRFIKSPYLHHAVVNAYEQLLADKTLPFYVLRLTMDPANIDVNVHPTKQEIKFLDERTVYMVVQAAVKHGLAQHSVMPTIDFDQETSFNTFNTIRHPNVASLAPQNPRSVPKKNTDNWQGVYDVKKGGSESQVVTFQSQWPEEKIEAKLFDDEKEEKLPMVPIQLHRKYILTALKSGFVLIHQQNAHERILFEEFVRKLDAGGGVGQRILFPRTMEFNASDAALLTELLPVLGKLGMDIQPFGQNSFVVHALPAEIHKADEVQIIDNVLELYKNSAREDKIEARMNIAKALAKEASLKSGTALDEQMMTNLIDELFACEMPNATVDGKPTFVTYNMAEIDRQFD